MLAPCISPDALRYCLAVIRPALLLAPSNFLHDVRDRLTAAGITAAVAARNTPLLFDWLVTLLARQGISNHAAELYVARRGSPRWADLAGGVAGAHCPRLRSWWSFAGCGYRRDARSCAIPHHVTGCPVPALPARKGVLAEAAAGLWLFTRDVADGDLVGWIDQRLADADPGQGAPDRARRLRGSVLVPLCNVPGTGPKTWSMILAELLLGGDPDRERWVAAGASFIAVDSLVHAYLHRTGILHRLGAEHPYGPSCTAPGGCSDVIAALAERIDARRFNPEFPAIFPRWVQFAIWSYCAEGGFEICQGRRINDRERCGQRFCPAYRHCDRVALHPQR